MVSARGRTHQVNEGCFAVGDANGKFQAGGLGEGIRQYLAACCDDGRAADRREEDLYWTFGCAQGSFGHFDGDFLHHFGGDQAGDFDFDGREGGNGRFLIIYRGVFDEARHFHFHYLRLTGSQQYNEAPGRNQPNLRHEIVFPILRVASPACRPKPRGHGSSLCG
jgi:hypothetical protein